MAGEISTAGTLLTKQQFEWVRTKNRHLITVFQHCITDIKEHLMDTYLFLLTDAEGVLLAMDYSENLEATVSRSPIRLGLYLTEESCGVNAVKAIALNLKIKESTVNYHKKIIFDKLGVQSSTEAVSIASRLSYL